MTQREARQEIIAAFAARGIEAMYGKGGFFLRGQGFVTFARARKLTGAGVPDSMKRQQREAILYGDAAIVHLIAGRM